MPQDGKNVYFTKMHGAGNDYIYINAMREVPENLPILAQLISDRHFGVGSDGLVVILPSEKADFRMRMFNADGSEAEMCGNASRCIGKYVYEKGLTDKKDISLETKAGVKLLSLDVIDGKVKTVTVDMGVPTIKYSDSAVILPSGNVVNLTEIGMGNPHAVVFTSDLSDTNVLGNGPILESAEMFPNKANIEFVNILSDSKIKMRVWERGSGETLACGTGACAAVVAASIKGYINREADLYLKGGVLGVRWDELSNHVFLTGGAQFVCDGEFYIPENCKFE